MLHLMLQQRPQQKLAAMQAAGNGERRPALRFAGEGIFNTLK
jgi:hypothetical protein